MFMANVNPNARGPNATYIPPARIGLTLDLSGLRWVCGDLRWVREAFQIPTCWYQQCESLALGVLPDARTQRERVCDAVEYRLNAQMKCIIISANL